VLSKEAFMAKRLRARPSNTLILVAGSFIVLVLVGIAGLNRPLPTYLIAASNLGVGTGLSSELVRSESLDLGSIAQSYATDADIDGKALLLPVASGELIPRRALGEALAHGQTSIRIVPDLKPASQITPGSRVSIWQVVELEDDFEPQLLVGSSLVSDVLFGDGLFAGELPEVELVLSRTEAAMVLRAVTSESAIYLLPLS
jgi:Flp pilus assembly protein CpaB